MKRYNVKNTSTDVVTVYDSHGKAYVLKKNHMCNIDIKPDSTRLIVEEIEDKKLDTRKTKKEKYIEVK